MWGKAQHKIIDLTALSFIIDIIFLAEALADLK